MQNSELVPENELKKIQQLDSELKLITDDLKTLLSQTQQNRKELQGTVTDLNQFHAAIEKVNKTVQGSNKVFEEEKRILTEREKIQERVNQSTIQQVKVIQDINKAYSDNTKAAKESSTAQSQNAQTLGDLSRNAYNEAAKSIDNTTRQYVAQQANLRNIQSELKKLEKQYQNSRVSEGNYLFQKTQLIQQEQDQKAVVKDLGDTVKNYSAIVNTQIGSYKNLSAQYSQMMIVLNNMSESETKNGLTKQQLEDHARTLRLEMSRLKKETGDNTLDVGKYDLAVKDLTQTLSIIDPRLGTIITRLQRITPLKQAWITTNDKLVKSLNLTARSATILQGAMIGLIAGGIYLIIKAFQEMQEETQKVLERQKEEGKIYEEIGKNASSLATSYYRLQNQWNNLADDIQSKTQFITENKDEFYKLGIEIDSVSDAENILVSNSEAVVQAISLRARAAAYYQIATEKYRQAIEIQNRADDLNTGQEEVNFNGKSFTIINEDDPTLQLNRIIQEQVQSAAQVLFDEGGELINMVNELQNEANQLLEDAGITRYNKNKENKDKLIQAENSAQIELIKLQAEAQKRILADNQKNYQERTEALNNYIEYSRKAIEKARDNQLDNENLGENQRKLIREKANNEILKLNEESEKLFLNILNDYTGKQIAAIQAESDKRKQILSDEYDSELKLLAESYSKRELNSEQYSQSRQEAEKKYRIDQYNEEEKNLTNILSLAALTDEERVSVEEQLAKSRLEYQKYINAEITKNFEDEGKKREENEKKVQRAIQQLIGQTFDFVSTLIEARSEKELESIEQYLEEEEKADEKREKELERNAEKELEEVNEQAIQGVITADEAAQKRKEIEDQEEANRIAIENNRTQREKTAEQRTREIKRRQAVYDKAIALTQATIQGALAIVQSASNPILLAITTALVATQIATIAAQNIPQYKDGTDAHPGGLAYLGDGGRAEMVIFPDGNIGKSESKKTLYDLPAGTQVLPDFNKAIEQSVAIANVVKSGGEVQPFFVIENAQGLSLQKENNQLTKKLIKAGSGKASFDNSNRKSNYINS